MRRQFSLDMDQRILMTTWSHDMLNLMRDVAGYTDFAEIILSYHRASDVPYAEYLFNEIRPRFMSLLEDMRSGTGLNYKKLLEVISRLCLLCYYESDCWGYPKSRAVASAVATICKHYLLEDFPSLLQENEPDYDTYSDTLLISEILNLEHKDILKVMLHHKWFILENYLCRKEALRTTRNSMKVISSRMVATIADIICYLAISFHVFRVRAEDRGILYTFWEQSETKKENNI